MRTTYGSNSGNPQAAPPKRHGCKRGCGPTLCGMLNKSQPEISLNDVLRAMRSALNSLSGQPRFSFQELMVATMRELAREGRITESGEDYVGAWQRLRDINPLSFLLIEGYQQILSLGHIVPWPNTPNSPNINWYRATEKGRQWSLNLEPVPEGIDGFLAALNALVPTLDIVIRQYVEEAVVTYNRRAWFATAVMIGAASEKAVYLLIEELLAAVGSASERQAITKVIRERILPKMFEHINKVLIRQRDSKRLPYSVHEGCDNYLLSLFEAIRVQRNEAVHPTIGEVTPESVRLILSVFPSARRKVYDLMEWSRTQAANDSR